MNDCLRFVLVVDGSPIQIFLSTHSLSRDYPLSRSRLPCLTLPHTPPPASVPRRPPRWAIAAAATTTSRTARSRETWLTSERRGSNGINDLGRSGAVQSRQTRAEAAVRWSRRILAKAIGSDPGKGGKVRSRWRRPDPGGPTDFGVASSAWLVPDGGSLRSRVGRLADVEFLLPGLPRRL